MGAFTTALISIASVAPAVGGAIQAFKKPKEPSAPSVPNLPEPPTVADAEASAQERVEKKRRSIARNKTVFTSPLGLTDEQKSSVATKTLTGQ